jgi:hypothetical protein
LSLSCTIKWAFATAAASNVFLTMHRIAGDDKARKVHLLDDTMIAICENAGPGFVKDAIEVLWEDLTPEQQKEFVKEHAGELSTGWITMGLNLSRS